MLGLQLLERLLQKEHVAVDGHSLVLLVLGKLLVLDLFGNNRLVDLLQLLGLLRELVEFASRGNLVAIPFLTFSGVDLVHVDHFDIMAALLAIAATTTTTTTSSTLVAVTTAFRVVGEIILVLIILAV